MATFAPKTYNDGMDVNQVIGVTVWRNVHDGRYPIPVLQTALTDAGFDKGNLIPETERTNFTNAARDVAVENKSLARKVVDDAEHIVMVIIAETVNAATEQVDFTHTTKLTYHKDGGLVEGVGPLADAVVVRYNAYKATVDDNRVRNMITNVLRGEGSGVNLCPSGGVYFVPRQRITVVDKLATLAHDLKLGTVYSLRVPNLGAEKEAAVASVRDDIATRLTDISQRVTKVNNRINSLTSKRQEAEAVKELMGLYADLLDGEQVMETLQGQYQALEAQITERMEAVEKARALKLAEKEAAAVPATECAEPAVAGETVPAVPADPVTGQDPATTPAN
jgi:hypothetical protein